jgi:DNA-binding MarR family transcriptional regulator
VTLTAKGLKLIDKVLPTHVDTEAELLSGLSTTERDQLAGLLRSLLESLGDKRD